MSNKPSVNRDYSNILIDDDKDLEEYSVNERRKYLLNKIYEVGLADDINQCKMAKKFNVSNVMIHKDLKVLRQYLRENPEKNHISETTGIVKHAVKKLLDDGKYKKASDLQMDFSEWLEDRGAIDKEPEQVELIDTTISSEYEVIDVVSNVEDGDGDEEIDDDK